MKVLVGYDGSVESDGALYDLESAGLPRKGEFLVLTQITPWTTFAPESGPLLGAQAIYPESEKESLAEAGRVAKRGAAWLRAHFPGWKARTQAGVGDPAIGLLDFAKKWKPDLVVLGSHGRSAISRLFLGSVSLKVVNHSATDVRITRPRIRSASAAPRILIGMDGSRGSLDAVASVTRRSWPKGSKARIVAAHDLLKDPPPAVIPDEVQRKEAEKRRDALELKLAKAVGELAAAGLEVELANRSGDPREVLLHEAKTWKADMLVMGCRGMGLVDRFLIGSVSSALASLAPCTVEVIRLPWSARGKTKKKKA
jgi:nucleotide-binding universal stress UspA family protein